MKLKTFTTDDIRGKRVLVRVDFNVPMTEDGHVADDTRINAHIPLINELSASGAQVVLCSHLGRPKGAVVAKYSLKPVADRLAVLIGHDVVFASDCIGPEAEHAVSQLKTGDIAVLENLRFHPEEEKNDHDFAKALTRNYDIFIMDAFSASHRAHASTRAASELLQSFAGPLLIKEIEMLSTVRDEPKHPFVLILGGAKVSDKIGVIENLMSKVDSIIIGGGMAFTFLKAKGAEIGRSICETEKVEFAKDMLSRATSSNVSIHLPTDAVVASEFKEDAHCSTVSVDAIPVDQMGLDIGPESVKSFKNVLATAKTVLWNGPMGVFEMPAFANGTSEIAASLAEITANGAMTVAGGGDSAAAIAKFGYTDDITHVSTGGGASLEFFEGKILPGVEPFVL